MNKTKQLKVVLFALTGFGNPVLKALLKDERVDLKAVFTTKYEQPFPYYPEEHLLDLCNQLGVTCHYGVKVSSEEGVAMVHQYAPDLIIMSTFKQILRSNVLGIPAFGVVNIHPSLLPSYRGPCPTNNVLLNGEKATGLTVHYVTEEIDEGNILLQKSISIEEIENDGQLRQTLANLAGTLIPEIINLFADFSKPAGISQNHDQASLAPKPTPDIGFLELSPEINTIKNKIRALNPLPGTSVLLEGQRIPVNGVELFENHRADGLYETPEAVEWVINRQGIRLFKKVQQ
jgi:methionyl-tRNA formyltransferase